MKLRAEQIIKTYGDRSVVKGVSLEVNQGEIVGLFRPKWRRKNHYFLYDCWFDKTKFWTCLFRW